MGQLAIDDAMRGPHQHHATRLRRRRRRRGSAEPQQRVRTARTVGGHPGGVTSTHDAGHASTRAAMRNGVLTGGAPERQGKPAQSTHLRVNVSVGACVHVVRL